MKLATFKTLAFALLFLGGCGRQPTPNSAKPGPRVFETRGVIRRIAPGGAQAVIRHEEIPGYMPAMTMELNVRDPKEMEGLATGDSIAFRLVATAETHWIEGVRRLAGARGPVEAAERPPAQPASRELKPGDLLPDAELLAEDGRTVKFSDFRGQALAFTFFFTRCPLPDYCPRMNQRFSLARELLLQRKEGPTNWQFLCVSFDPDFDKPKVLTNYAGGFRGEDTEHWLFASASSNALAQLAPRLDFMVTREGGSFSHNLRTVVLDPQGRVHRQFDGNTWTAEQLAEALLMAARER